MPPASVVLIVAGVVSALVLIVSLVVIAVVLWPEGNDDAIPTGVELCVANPTDPLCQAAATTSSTTSSTASTTASTSTTTSLATGGSSDDTAIGVVQGALSQCGQGGMLGTFAAIETAPGVYLVTVPITFEGFEDAVDATWIVDLNSASPEPVAQDQTSAELICIG